MKLQGRSRPGSDESVVYTNYEVRRRELVDGVKSRKGSGGLPERM